MREIKLLLLLSLIICITGCTNISQYEGFKQVKIPDDRIGTAYIPNNWEFYKNNECLYIRDINSQEIVAIEYMKSDGISEINPNIQEYTEIVKLKDLTGNSNKSNCYLFRYEVNGETLDLIRLSFASTTDESETRVILFVFLDQNMDEDIIIKISKSYNASGE